ncbi:MAG: dihydrodipicolinate reductase [Rickettsiaceae bacterium]|jgi:4-hydroxy-tetrahydrodipicolinate reductase|nr:dihydrodipicolinate reductase [Rickettsiaceae bacterium]
MVDGILKIGVHGSTGKMGLHVIKLIDNDPTLELSGKFSRAQQVSLDNLCKSSNVIIDFSLPEAVPALINTAVKHKCSLVIGTTGLSQAQHNEIKQAAELIPILYSANMSYGILVLNRLIEIASSLLSKEDFDVAITDKHHKFKKDSPSGTALMLGKSLHQAWNIDGELDANSKMDANKFGNICFSSIKIGNIVGEHSVVYANLEERIILSHIAENKAVFAKGAIKAAKWLADKPKGLYSLQDTIE